MSTLTKHPERLGVAKLGPGADLPKWVSSATLMSITATAAETSIVCTYSVIPKKAKPEGPFSPYEVEGPLDFALTGILSALLVPLAEAEVSVFTLSTFDTDWILVPTSKESAAEEAWRRSGHTVQTADQTGNQE
ncbi:MAG TPA: ACT domain-containing protein [Nocardioidaceae bacterium]|nr:ACT domain-containing protein [Nocardioidaceae bacterium]